MEFFTGVYSGKQILELFLLAFQYHKKSGNFQWKKLSDSEKLFTQFFMFSTFAIGKCHWKKSKEYLIDQYHVKILPLTFPDFSFATISMPRIPHHNMDVNPYSCMSYVQSPLYRFICFVNGLKFYFSGGKWPQKSKKIGPPG